jgi:antitoxin (DNA-binding transcriptional repressor) of toxin-antitoxin stability system
MCYRRTAMARIGVRELRQHASRYLDRVKAGETIEVALRGQLVALLVPPTPAAASRDRLIAAGQLVSAKTAFVVPRRRTLADGEPSASAVLQELRDERLS